MTEAGVSYVFANLGSDHPAARRSAGRGAGDRPPRAGDVTCPNEMVALSCRARLRADHRARAGRAGARRMRHPGAGRRRAQRRQGPHPGADLRRRVALSPRKASCAAAATSSSSGSRTCPTSAASCAATCKYENEIRTGRNIKQIVHRALQFARSDPKGPVYLMGAREVMEEEVPPVAIDPAALAADLARRAAAPRRRGARRRRCCAARRPLVVTSYLGRNTGAVAELVRLSRRLAVAVLESVPNAMNFPTDDPMYQGNQWNDPRQNPALAEADLVLVLDSDVPWIPVVSRPREDARDLPYRRRPAEAADAAMVHRRKAGCSAPRPRPRCGRSTRVSTASKSTRRRARPAHRTDAARHAARKAGLLALEQPHGDVITGEYLTACIRAHVGDDAIVAEREDLQLPHDHQSSADDAAGQHDHQRRRLARLERRRGDRCEAGAPGEDR